ncbi:MAG: acetyl-CoA decarbonylase/synthase complex subunit delta [Coriobacteriales bacterium]|jgi:acetyl-CoA decarbonylase/synthase complex subunit delta|nr:acetyl-CoA decarbonylase/synthase complex subunit delta [Coriobacteriales bacterium]
MPFEAKKKEFNVSVGVLEFGHGPAVQLGGENVWPLYTFDGPLANPPRVGVEISDLGTEHWNVGLQGHYANDDDIAGMAKRAGAMPGAEFVCLSFEGADPVGMDRNVEDCAALAQAVSEACPLPLCIAGSGNTEKDEELFQRLAEALEGRNILFLSATEDSYKAIGTGVALAWGQKLAAESAVDINLAKQLNLLLSQLGIANSAIAMNIGTAAAGYGFEYVASTMERVKAAALAQNDVALQVPIITPVGKDAWGTKETLASEEEYPLWGSSEERGIYMEVVTAAACLASGSNAVILRHPQSVSTIAEFIGLLTTDEGEGER